MRNTRAGVCATPFVSVCPADIVHGGSSYFRALTPPCAVPSPPHARIILALENTVSSLSRAAHVSWSRMPEKLHSAKDL
ncbi:hypothetical protein C8J57DRAFT_1502394 [Mycena rebaudengoi]|nr:hypothetical protein C8J57DRAFT_1502394 [Mycena rebaudengoi]